MHEGLFPICQRLNEIKEEVQECPDCSPNDRCEVHEEAWCYTVSQIHCYVEEHKKKHG